MADFLRAGIIGLDTSHVRVFTETWNKEDARDHIPGVRVVAAFPSFSPDVERSVRGVKDYKPMLSGQFGVKMTESIDELVDQVDAILIESVDGRRHLPELKAVVESKGYKGQPVYIDKPFAASFSDAEKLVKIIKEKAVPCFSSSSLRFEPNLRKFLNDKSHGKVQGCDAFSPAHLEKSNPGFFWYGIHGVEILYTIMGRGCKSVRCTTSPGGKDGDGKERGVDLAVGVWEDGRIGTMRGIREGKADYGAFALCANGYQQIQPDPKSNLYAGLLREITQFFQTKKSPVPIEDTLEICAFIQAAWDSSQKDCGDVKIAT